MVAVNLKTQEYDVRIDRQTRWGNPFKMAHGSDRARVVSDYRRWLWREIKLGRVALEALAELRGKRLGCHCAPLACHGDVLTAAAAWAAEQIEKRRRG